MAKFVITGRGFDDNVAMPEIEGIRLGDGLARADAGLLRRIQHRFPLKTIGRRQKRLRFARFASLCARIPAITAMFGGVS